MTRKEQILSAIDTALESDCKWLNSYYLGSTQIADIEFQLELKFDMIFDLSKIGATYTIDELVDEINKLIPERF